MIAEMAKAIDLPPGGREFWAIQRDPDSQDALINHPDLVTGSIRCIAKGRVPPVANPSPVTKRTRP